MRSAPRRTGPWGHDAYGSLRMGQCFKKDEAYRVLAI
jgi:hypothetical protein